MSPSDMINLMKKLEGKKGHKALAIIIETAREDKKRKESVSANNLFHTMNEAGFSYRSQVSNKTIVIKDKIALLDYLANNKHKVLNSLCKEQNFRTPLNQENT
jgi:hypothetical protein